jgi:integrase
MDRNLHRFCRHTVQTTKIPTARKNSIHPHRKEIDDLIAGCSSKKATLLQLLKETGMRIGEARNLTWVNIDLEDQCITLNNPEKRGKPRAFKISSKLSYVKRNAKE